jgi:hypothetical protein
MAYNYSRYHLVDNVDTVRWLVKLAQDHEVGQRTFTEWSEAREWRNKILGLLACLAYNQPEMAHVKNTLRTWIDRTGDGLAIVCVGPGDKSGRKLRGPKPRAVELGTRAQEVLELAAVKSNLDMLPLASLISGLDKRTEVRILEPPPPEGIQFFREMVNEVSGLGFEILSVEPHLHMRVVKKQEPQA